MIDEETVIILVSVGYFNLQREPIKIFCQYIQWDVLIPEWSPFYEWFEGKSDEHLVA